MSARSVCSGTRPSRYHSERAISAPFRRPETLILMPSAPRRMAFGPRAHRAAEHDAALELLGDALGHQVGVELGLADLLDVDVHGHAHHLGDLAAQALDVLALLADDDARARGVDRDARVLRRALDLDAAHRGVGQLLAQELAHLEVVFRLSA